MLTTYLSLKANLYLSLYSYYNLPHSKIISSLITFLSNYFINTLMNSQIFITLFIKLNSLSLSTISLHSYHHLFHMNHSSLIILSIHLILLSYCFTYFYYRLFKFHYLFIKYWHFVYSFIKNLKQKYYKNHFKVQNLVFYEFSNHLHEQI